jgi:hypothetical protein
VAVSSGCRQPTSPHYRGARYRHVRNLQARNVQQDAPGLNTTLGVRAGYLVMGDAQVDQQDNRAVIGAWFDVPFARRFSVEVGADAAPAQEEWQDNNLLIGRGAVRWHLLRGPAGLYLNAGGGVLHENAAESSYTDGYIEGGLGTVWRMGGTEWHLRANYWSLMESANPEDMFLVTLGVGL